MGFYFIKQFAFKNHNGVQRMERHCDKYSESYSSAFEWDTWEERNYLPRFPSKCSISSVEESRWGSPTPGAALPPLSGLRSGTKEIKTTSASRGSSETKQLVFIWRQFRGGERAGAAVNKKKKRIREREKKSDGRSLCSYRGVLLAKECTGGAEHLLNVDGRESAGGCLRWIEAKEVLIFSLSLSHIHTVTKVAVRAAGTGMLALLLRFSANVVPVPESDQWQVNMHLSCCLTLKVGPNNLKKKWLYCEILVADFSRMHSNVSSSSSWMLVSLLGLSTGLTWSGKVPLSDEHLAATLSPGLSNADRSSSPHLRGVGSMSWSLAQQISLTQQTRKKTSSFQTNTVIPPSILHHHHHQLPTVDVIAYWS